MEPIIPVEASDDGKGVFEANMAIIFFEQLLFSSLWLVGQSFRPVALALAYLVERKTDFTVELACQILGRIVPVLNGDCVQLRYVYVWSCSRAVLRSCVGVAWRRRGVGSSHLTGPTMYKNNTNTLRANGVVGWIDSWGIKAFSLCW